MSGVQKPGQTRHGQSPRGREYRSLQSHPAPVRPRPQNGCPRSAPRQPFGKLGVHRHGQIVRTRRSRFGRTQDHQIQIARSLRSQRFCDVTDPVQRERPSGRFAKYLYGITVKEYRNPQTAASGLHPGHHDARILQRPEDRGIAAIDVGQIGDLALFGRPGREIDQMHRHGLGQFQH